MCPCGFQTGDRVRMQSALLKSDGTSLGIVHGTVGLWHAGCGHIVEWDEIPTATGLPNPNVKREDAPLP